jgi:hypothetical protein
MPVDRDFEYVADNYVFTLVEEGNGPFMEKNTLTSDSNIF